MVPTSLQQKYLEEDVDYAQQQWMHLLAKINNRQSAVGQIILDEKIKAAALKLGAAKQKLADYIKVKDEGMKLCT